MGKVIKSERFVLPVTEPPEFQRVIKAPKPTPQGKVLPLDHYGAVLSRAEILAGEKRFTECLQDLLDLEVTRFEELRPHELLAEAYLHLGQLDLAREQCMHCAQIIEKTDSDFSKIPCDFNRLLEAAGDPAESERRYEEVMASPLHEDNFFQGSQSALHLAAHRMNEHRYHEAETLLTAFRDRCLAFIKEE